MIEYRNGRRRIRRHTEREPVHIRLILPALILLTAGGLLIWLAGSGLQEGLLGLSLPAYRLLSSAGRPESAVPEESEPEPEPVLSVSGVETVYQSAEAMTQSQSLKPQILIYHTHATEAYLQYGAYSYAESGKWRTMDSNCSVIAVGALLADILSEHYGYCVLHDTTNYEPPKLSTAYSRSLSAMQRYQARYPTLNVYIDVHRDAYGTSETELTEPQDYVMLDGQELARIMFVVGTGKGATGAGFSELPDFDANYAFAEAVMRTLDETHEGLTREIRVKAGRYNQHVSTQCLLVEVGHNANTLEQALASIPYLAAAIHRALSETVIETASVSGMDVWTPSDPNEDD